MVVLLLDRGADPKARDGLGQNAAEIADAAGHEKTAQILLNALAD